MFFLNIEFLKFFFSDFGGRQKFQKSKKMFGARLRFLSDLGNGFASILEDLGRILDGGIWGRFLKLFGRIWGEKQ